MGGYPQIIHFCGIFPYEPSIFWGTLILWKPSYTTIQSIFGNQKLDVFFLGAAELATLSKLSSQGVNLAENSRKGRW